jgi:hypothetical protein
VKKRISRCAGATGHTPAPRTQIRIMYLGTPLFIFQILFCDSYCHLYVILSGFLLSLFFFFFHFSHITSDPNFERVFRFSLFFFPLFTLPTFFHFSSYFIFVFLSSILSLSQRVFHSSHLTFSFSPSPLAFSSLEQEIRRDID